MDFEINVVGIAGKFYLKDIPLELRKFFHLYKDFL